jgi:hypothetical protein
MRQLKCELLNCVTPVLKLLHSFVLRTNRLTNFNVMQVDPGMCILGRISLDSNNKLYFSPKCAMSIKHNVSNNMLKAAENEDLENCQHICTVK